jgi:peptide/nickel transport system substrate-binding protein
MDARTRQLATSLLWYGLLIALVISLAGCTPTAQAPTPEATKAVQPAASEKTITIVIPEDPPSFNALISDTGYDALVMKMSLLGLTAVDPDGNVYPVLAADLPTEANGGVVVNKDSGAMDVTWKMRNDVTWSDGQPVTADDVLFTYKAMTDPNTGTWFPGSDLVSGVDKIDEYSFVVHFSSVYPSYLTLFGGRQIVIWPAHYCKADQGFQNWDCGREPLSDGPYLLKEWVTGDHLTLAKNPKYYEQGKPQIDQIIIKIVPDATVRETMMRQGDADALMWATEQVADNLKDAKDVKVSISPTARFVMRLFINLAAQGSTDPAKSPNPFFVDVRVRQAIREAIDVDAITSSVWHGFAKPVWTEFFRPPYTCDIPRPKFDPEAAKTLLEQAGWIDKDGDGIRECHGCKNAKEGTEFKFELATYSEYGEPLNLTQQLIAEDLKSVGIQADLLQIQGSVMWADSASGGTEQTGNFEVDLYDDGYAGIDPTDFLWQYYASGSATPDQGWNIGRWISEDMDNLLNEAYTLDEQARKDTFCQMGQLLDQELPEILLFSTINADAYSTRLNGIQANVNSVVSWNVADWTLTK